ncbi:MAG: M14 family metallocarboxypeptidase [Bermanella sp.]
MTLAKKYPIGTLGKKWGELERDTWLKQQDIKRSYEVEVLDKLTFLKEQFGITQYGALSFNPGRYPLYALKSKNWHSNKPCVLITGGVHGYEKSGVQGAIRFLQIHATQYLHEFNIVVLPCVSPWGYETINRWNPQAVDPNRSFFPGGRAQEATAAMQYVASLKLNIAIHIDLHETTDTDNSEFRPAQAARDASTNENWDIPDGFYLVGDSQNPADEFQRAIIESVKKVTHIAPADANNKIIGEALSQHGVINYDVQNLGLCAGFSDAQYSTTTEVYPDSDKVDEENCINAQVAAITGALDFVLGKAAT